jgi:hypothetical protein
MKTNRMTLSLLAALGPSLAAGVAGAAERVDVAILAANQSNLDASFYEARIRVTFTSDLGMGEVTYGGGFTVDCGSPDPWSGLPSTGPSPLVASQVHADPIFPFAVFNSHFDLGSSFFAIPGFQQMPSGSVRICRLIWKAAANFSNFPLDIRLDFGSSSISIISQEIELSSSGFTDFPVQRGAPNCPPRPATSRSTGPTTTRRFAILSSWTSVRTESTWARKASASSSITTATASASSSSG